MATEVIVLNGASSSGKTSLARCLLELLEEPWITLGVDDLIGALAPSLVGEAPQNEGRPPLLAYGADGMVQLSPAWRDVEAAWYAGVVAMARAGLRVILDEVLLDGGTGQRRVAHYLDGLSLLWVGVHCDPAIAVQRERARSDRMDGMATSQASKVHDGVHYDVVVDTTAASSEHCARVVIEQICQS